MIEHPDVERILTAIATITPTPSETQHAVARVRAALARRPSSRPRWIVPASCAAAVMLVAAFLIIFAVNRIQSWAQNRFPVH